MVNLAGKVRAEDSLRLFENQNPNSGEKLTPESNTTPAKSSNKCFSSFLQFLKLEVSQ
jgi:hypothetical protein